MLLNILVWFLAGYGFGRLWHDITVEKLNLEEKQVVNGLHFHHTLFAIVFFFISILDYQFVKSGFGLYILFAGLGLMAEYYLRWGRLHFITRSKNRNE